ncbi:MAG: biosynthetic peptidoglycan transglycosylase [Candidatus Dormiibacterota bacterium]
MPKHGPRVPPEAADRGRRWRWAAALAALSVTLIWCGTWMATPSTGRLQARVAALDRSHQTRPLNSDVVPRYLAEAVIAVEDQNFYLDRGVNLEGLFRAAGYDLLHLCTCEGGSTITEQLAEDLYLHGSDRTVWLRWVDITLALKIEDHLSKTQVLDEYLSEVRLGNGTVGMEQASRRYFGQPLSRDDLAQLALLAGLPQAPGVLDPLRNPEGAKERRAAVLQQMAVDGYISKAQARRADRAPAL